MEEGRMKIVAIFLLTIFTTSCVYEAGKISVVMKNKTLFHPSVESIRVINHQIVIAGSDLDSVTKFHIKEGSSDTKLEIESKSKTSIVANTISNVTFAAGKAFSFVLSDADASATFAVNFSLCDSDLNGKGFNCAVAPNDKDVLSFDATTNKWVPRNINGLAYKGVYNAASGVVPPGTPDAGDYYIISNPGSINSVSYAIGDWISYSGDEWQRIANSRDVLSVFGRTGNVSARKGDYQFTQLADVAISTPTNNQILKYNSATSSWINSTLSYTETDPTVSAFAKTSLPTCGTGEVLKSNGTTLSCVTDNAGGSAFVGTANRAMVTDGSGALAVSTITDTVLGYLSGATSNIQTQIDSKLATSSFVDWSTSGVATIAPSRINLTTANRAVVTDSSGMPVASSITTTVLGYLSGVTSSIQTQIDSKLASSSFVDWSTSGVATIAPSRINLTTANRVAVTNGSSTLTAGSVTTTELGYVSGVTSAIQTQIDNIVSGATGLWSAGSGTTYLVNGNVGIGTNSPTSKLQVAGGQAVVAYHDAASNTTVDFNDGNMQSTAAAAGTLTLSNLKAGGSYTLFLTNTSGGSYTLVTGQTLKCQPECVSDQVVVNANAHTVLSILSTGTITYVSWMRGF
jgi:hypothetical protein